MRLEFAHQPHPGALRGRRRRRRRRGLRLRGRRGRRLRRMQGLGQVAPQPQAERQRHRAQQEGDAPAVGVERGRRHQVREAKAHQPADCRGEPLAGSLPGNRQPATVRRRGFQQIGRGRPHLAAQREALHHPRDHREDRRGEADLSVGRDQRQRDDRHPHQGEAQHHRRPAPDAVGVGADDDPADRPRHETRAERHQRRHQAHVGRVRREEGVPDLDGEEGVGDEVVELERVADRRRGDRAARQRSLVARPGERRCAVLGQSLFGH